MMLNQNWQKGEQRYFFKSNACQIVYAQFPTFTFSNFHDIVTKRTTSESPLICDHAKISLQTIKAIKE